MPPACRGDADDLDRSLAVQVVEDRLQIGSTPRRDDGAKGAHRRILSQRRPGGWAEQDFWQAVLYLHLLAMAFFVGGQLVFAIAVVPVERTRPTGSGCGRSPVASATARLRPGALVASGWAMASHDGLFGDSTLQLKLALVGLVVVLSLLHLRRPRLHLFQAAILIVSLVIVWLGLELAS